MIVRGSLVRIVLLSAAIVLVPGSSARSAVNVLSGMPEYRWWYGCTPTASGMMIGYWDGKPGYGNLYDGDAGVWEGNGSWGTRSMVASDAHIISGYENGFIFGDYRNSDSYPDHINNPDCIADFLKTQDGNTPVDKVAGGLEAYIAWNDPDTSTDESYEAMIVWDRTSYSYGTWDYDALKAEIDGSRPVMLGMLLVCPQAGLMGHAVVAYGYRDDMYTVRVPFYDGGWEVQTVPGFAVMDTWSNGTLNSNWLDENGDRLLPTIDAIGR